MGFITQALGLNPQIPAPPAPPPPPPPVPDIAQAQKNIQDNEALSRKPQGTAATMLTGALGDASIPTSGTKTLLGS